MSKRFLNCENHYLGTMACEWYYDKCHNNNIVRAQNAVSFARNKIPAEVSLFSPPPSSALKAGMAEA